MNSGLSRLGIALLAAMFAPALLAADLEKLDVAALPGDRVELKLQFDEPVAAPRGYTIEQPARIALDLPGVQNKLGTKNRELSVGNTRSVTVVEAKDRTRLIINHAVVLHHPGGRQQPLRGGRQFAGRRQRRFRRSGQGKPGSG